MDETKRMKWNWHGALLAVFITIYIAVYVIINLTIDTLHIRMSPTSIIICLLPLFVYLTSLFLYFKSKSVMISKKQLLHAAIIGTLICSYAIYLMGKNEYYYYFNYNRWVSEQEQRVHMIDHFLNKNRLVGLKKSDVIDLLSVPTETSYFEAPNRWVYYLGPERGVISIDSEWLLINFDDGEHVISYDIVTD